MACEQCEIIMINGHRCHEIGCPIGWKDYDIPCFECGCDFRPTDLFQIICPGCVADAVRREEESL